jgi:hypothetical protein
MILAEDPPDHEKASQKQNRIDAICDKNIVEAAANIHIVQEPRAA